MLGCYTVLVFHSEMKMWQRFKTRGGSNAAQRMKSDSLDFNMEETSILTFCNNRT